MLDNAHINAAKKHLFTHALALGEVNVQFYPGAPDVEIPAFLSVEGVQVFVYGLAQSNPIPDLVIGVEGIRATLSFGREPHMTFVPWTAVGALVGEAFGIVFPEAATGESAITQEAAPTPASRAPVAPVRPTLSLVR
jgi:hypothetical protein